MPTTEQNLNLLIAIANQQKQGSVDYQKIGDDLGISAVAASGRWARFKKRYVTKSKPEATGRAGKALEDDYKLMHAIIKQIPVGSMNWKQIGDDLGGISAVAAAGRWSRFKKANLSTNGKTQTPKPRVNRKKAAILAELKSAAAATRKSTCSKEDFKDELDDEADEQVDEDVDVDSEESALQNQLLTQYNGEENTADSELYEASYEHGDMIDQPVYQHEDYSTQHANSDVPFYGYTDEYGIIDESQDYYGDVEGAGYLQHDSHNYARQLQEEEA